MTAGRRGLRTWADRIYIWACVLRGSLGVNFGVKDQLTVTIEAEGDVDARRVRFLLLWRDGVALPIPLGAVDVDGFLRRNAEVSFRDNH